MSQLVFDLPHRVAYEREDFLVAESSAQAIAMIDLWPDWPARMMILIGPSGAGKTHLASVWQKKSGARSIDAEALADEALLNAAAPLLVDDLDKKISADNEQEFFLLLNQVIHGAGFLLATASLPPSGASLWGHVKMPDLRSRLHAAPSVSLSAPDDTLIGAVMIKMFSDRQMKVSSEVIDFLLLRMERSFEAAARLVALLDRQAMAQRKPITIALARTALAQIASKPTFSS